MKKMVIATNNIGKQKEFQNLFPEFEVLSLKDLGYTKEIEEQGTTFEENAISKASQVSKEFNMVVLADDSGLEVEALGGAPGVLSARFAKDHDTEANNQKLMEVMKNETNRKARFVCVICVYWPNGEYKHFKGTCEGYIAYEPKGSNGFGYDPYFYLDEFKKTMAELPLSIKNQISHRAKAIKKLKEYFNENRCNFR